MDQDQPGELIDHTLYQLIEAIRLLQLLNLEFQQEIP